MEGKTITPTDKIPSHTTGECHPRTTTTISSLPFAAVAEIDPTARTTTQLTTTTTTDPMTARTVWTDSIATLPNMITMVNATNIHDTITETTMPMTNNHPGVVEA